MLQNPCRYREAGARRLRPWLTRLVAAVAPGTPSLGVRFTGDQEMRRLNRAFRTTDAATDVISFPGGETPDGCHLGDIVISVPTARRQAAAQGRSAEAELRALLLHGVLHCLGYDHETDGGEMARLERRLAGRWLAAGDGEREGDGGA